MLTVMIGFLLRLLAGICLLSLNLLFFSLVALLRLLPRFLTSIRFCLRWFLILSFRLYHLILERLSPYVYRWLVIDIFMGFARVVSSILLSLTIGLLILWLVGWSVNGWGIGLSLLHGLIVGLAWDEIEHPGGLNVGVKIE